MPKIRITLYETDSRNKERIIEIKDFDNRLEVQTYLDNLKAIPRPYKLKRGQIAYTLS